MDRLFDIIYNLNQQKTIDLIIAILVMAVLDIFSPFFSYLIIKMFNFKKNAKQIKNNTFYAPIKGFLKITGVYIAILLVKSTFELSDKVIDMITRIYKIIVIIFVANSLANSITRKSRFIKKIKEKSDKDIDDSATRILVRIIKAFIYVVAVFIIFAEIGYDLSGLVTGLGLGSVVLTLAAQDTIKNLLGGILIFIDKPFKVGDTIKISDYQGTVEDMTFRSTRIRTLDDSIVQIPNAQASTAVIENLSKIQKRRYKLDLDLVLDTKMDKMDKIKNQFMNLLTQNENVVKNSVNIHFTEIGLNGYRLTIICYINILDYIEFLDVKEDINKLMIEILNKNEIELAYDTKTIEIKR